MNPASVKNDCELTQRAEDHPNGFIQTGLKKKLLGGLRGRKWKQPVPSVGLRPNGQRKISVFPIFFFL